MRYLLDGPDQPLPSSPPGSRQSNPEWSHLLSSLPSPSPTEHLQPIPGYIGTSIAADSASDVLDLLNVGLIIVSPDGHILSTNASAATRLASIDGLTSEDGILVAESVAETEQLHRCIREAIDTGASGAMLIRRSRERRPHTLIVRSMGSREPLRALVAIRDSATRTQTFVDRVRTLFRLAPAEADIAVQLAMGSDLQEIAQARGVSINTIRTQMASAMVKVGVRRQAELVAAIACADVLL
jgi:DNA-binding CsgD family transcriptional regulator